MNENVWLAMAYARLATRAEILEHENAALRLELQRVRGPQPVDAPKESENA
jgi:hypothetical protein